MFDLFFPNMFVFGPWSGETLIKGSPTVKLIASYSYKVLMGVKTWSWYMPTIKSYFSLFDFVKIVSADRGPLILIFDFFKLLIAGKIIFLSSLNLSILSQCGFNPVTAILGFLLKWSFQNLLIIFIFFIIFDLWIFLVTYFNGSWVIIGLTDNYLLKMTIA